MTNWTKTKIYSNYTNLFSPHRNTVKRYIMKIHIFCMNEAGNIVAGLLTSNPQTAAAYIQRKTAAGLVTIKKVSNK